VKSERTTKKSDSDTKEEETIIWSCKECGLDFGGHHAMRQHQTAVSHKGYIRKVVDDSKTGTQKPNPPNNRQKTTAAPATGANDFVSVYIVIVNFHLRLFLNRIKRLLRTKIPHAQSARNVSVAKQR
jgi:hypothetical protein